MNDPRLKLLVEEIDSSIKHLNARILRNKDENPFSPDNVTARYLETILTKFIVKCSLQNLPTEIS